MRRTVVTDAGQVHQNPQPSPEPSPQPPEIIVEQEDENGFNGFLLDDRYSERPFLNDDLEYPREGTDQGLVVIFNQTFESTDNERKGSTRDVEELVVTLGRLGYNIEERYIFTNLNRGEIKKKIKGIAEEDHSHRNCVIVAFFTHGAAGDKLDAEQGELQAHEIWEPFATSTHFSNKPKMFIFQACKGQDKARLHTENKKENFSIIPKNIISSNLPPNMLIVYSTVEGYVSYRNPEYGSWFIQELCKNFHAYGRRDDVVSLIIRTSKCVATYAYYEKSVFTKQMPLFVSTLKKKFYLTKSKDRHATLTIKQRHDEILGCLDKLSSRIQALEQKNSA